MVWVRIDDGMPEHPKLLGISDRAFRAYVSALCYCNRQLTDGLLPPAFAGRKVADELVAARLWEPRDEGWKVHDFEDYNPTKAAVLTKREAAKQRMNKARSSREHGENFAAGSPNPVPVPVPLTVDPSDQPLAARFYKAEKVNDQVAALVDLAKANGRKLDGGRAAALLRRHSKTDVLDALHTSLGKNPAVLEDYMEGVLKNGRSGQAHRGAASGKPGGATTPAAEARAKW